MKRLLGLLLVTVLLLCGCSQAPEETSVTTTAEPQPTEPTPGLYAPGSAVEEETAGAVRTFLPDVSGNARLCFVGGDLLLFDVASNGSRTRITRLEGVNKGIGASTVVEAAVSPGDSGFRAGEREFVYYDAERREMAWLDRNFTRTRQIQLPEGAESPVVSSDLKTVYYCKDDEIYSVTVDDGITVLLKQQTCTYQALNGLHLNDSVLEVYLENGEGSGTVRFICTQTGKTLGEDKGTWEMLSRGESFMIYRRDGVLQEILLGSGSGPLKTLLVEGQDLLIEPMFACGGVAVSAADALSLYDIQSGVKKAAVSFREVGTVYSLTMDPDGRHIWMLHTELQTGQTSLFCWDSSKSLVSDEQLYIRERYSAEFPDEEGLRRCKQRAEALAERYGIRVLIWKEPPAPENYSFLYEHQVALIEDALDVLDQELSRLPEGFLAGLGEAGKSKKLTIGLVRSVESGNEPDGKGLQYFLNGDVYVALAVGEELRGSLYHELTHALDTFVFNRCNVYDDWDKLNPGGFRYYRDYTSYLDHPVEDKLLAGSSRYFVDTFSMCFPKEDRARIMEYAMREGQEELFDSDGMQKKLRQLCLGIRKAYGWDKESTVYPWETYLKRPLAKSK